MSELKLAYTPRSHFSRKVRIVAEALAIDLELVDAGNVAAQEPAAFGGNPLMKVPTLVLEDGRWVIDADHIVQTLVRRHDPDDRYEVFTRDVDQLNLRAVLNGIMAAEVELILAERTGIDTTRPRFDKMRTAMAVSLDWLEANATSFPTSPTYVGFHLVCMWDHVELYDVVPLAHPRLRDLVATWSELPFVASSRPT